MHILLLTWLLYLNVKNKTWRFLPKYYPNLIYVVFFNGLYYFLVHKKVLWDLKSVLFSKKVIRIIHACIINPLFLLLFLSKFPNSLLKQIIYINKWVAISIIIEWLFLKNKAVVFYRGWNLGWSLGIYIKMYLFSLLLKKKPCLTILLSIGCTVCFLIKFKTPVRKNMRKQFKGLKKFILG